MHTPGDRTRSVGLGLLLDSADGELCDLRQVASALCASVPRLHKRTVTSVLLQGLNKD